MNKTKLFLIFALSILIPSALISAEKTNSELEAMARAVIPEAVRDSVLLKSNRYELDDNEHELVFSDSEKTIYKIEINAFTKTVKKLEIKTRKNPLSKNVKLSTAEIEAIVLKRNPDAKNIRIKLDRERNGKCKYEAEFFVDNCKVDLDVNPENGDICEEEIKYL